MINQRKLMFKQNIAFELDFQPNAHSVIYLNKVYKVLFSRTVQQLQMP